MKIQNMLQTILEYKAITFALYSSLLKVMSRNKNLLVLSKGDLFIKIKYYDKTTGTSSVIRKLHKFEEMKSIIAIFKIENIIQRLSFKNGKF